MRNAELGMRSGLVQSEPKGAKCGRPQRGRMFVAGRGNKFRGQAAPYVEGYVCARRARVIGVCYQHTTPPGPGILCTRFYKHAAPLGPRSLPAAPGECGGSWSGVATCLLFGGAPAGAGARSDF
jgi:hypothetical protein